MLKIVHVIWQLSTGGAETMLVDIVNEQVKNHEVHILVVNNVMNQLLLEKIDPRARVYNCERTLGSRSILPIFKLNFCIYKIAPDIVHTHFGGLYKYIYWRGIMVRTIHNTNNDMNEQSHYSQCYAISQSVVDEWKTQGKDIPLVMNGIKTSAINTKKSGYFYDSKKHFIQVSRLFVAQKGQDILIDALAKVAKKRRDFVMHFVGEGPDDSLLKDMVATKNLSDIIVFEGLNDRDWIYDNLCEFDLYIQPSRYEGFGLTVAEACAAQIPVLVSDIEGPLEILDGGRLGMTFKNEDVDDLAIKILMFLDGEYDYSLIEPAYQRTLELYDVKRTATQYIEEYKKLLK